MAWIDCERTGIYQIGFTFGGRRFKRSLKIRDERTAEATRHRVEENIRLVTTGRLVIPADADIPTFLISDGKLSSEKQVANQHLALGKLYEHYEQHLPADSISPGTLRICKIHMSHVKRLIGDRRELRMIQRDDLQQYINERSIEIGKRGRPVSPTTIKKELSSLRTLWRWAYESELVNISIPDKGLRYPRDRQKFPFSTWDQIETRIRRGIPAGQTEPDLWDSLYLNTDELDELLHTVKVRAAYDFLYPMCFMAAHTGARRSELCRSMREDIDFSSGLVLIRERKRQKGRETFRHVPMSSRLRSVFEEWTIACGALSSYTFPTEHHVNRVRNNNRRENSDSVSPDEASDQLGKTLRGTRWEKIRGWHIFRHSFISNCASLCVDQRMIDSWVGHQTEEMRRRYRHLFPNEQTIQLEKVFGHRSSR